MNIVDSFLLSETDGLV